MKNLLQNLLIGFSILLCALIAVQWTREARMHGQIESLTTDLGSKIGALQASDGQLKRSESEVQRLEALKVELTDTLKSNRLEMSGLKKDLDKARMDARQLETFKDALTQANESIKKQNDAMLKQNEDIKKLATERNDIAAKFNKLTADYNDLAKQWNEQQQKLATPPAEPAAK